MLRSGLAGAGGVLREGRPGHPAAFSTGLPMITEWLLAIRTSHPHSRQKEESEPLGALPTAVVTTPEDVRRTGEARSSSKLPRSGFVPSVKGPLKTGPDRAAWT